MVRIGRKMIGVEYIVDRDWTRGVVAKARQGSLIQYVNANKSEEGIMNYSQSCNIHYPAR